jgi:hypothetical protein
MGDWKTERDALINETMAFARSIRSQQPVPVQQLVPPQRISDDVPKLRQDLASTAPAPPDTTFEEIIGDRRLEPMKWKGPERDEIKQRVANFKTHQQRFNREREDYATSTLKRAKASQDAIAEELRLLPARLPTFGDPTRIANSIIASTRDRQ